MAFFKSFQQTINLPSVSSIVDSLSNAVDGITSAVEEVSYSVADSVTEQVTSMIHSLRTEEETNSQYSDEKNSKVKEVNPLPEDVSRYGYGENPNVTEDNTSADHRTLNSDEPCGKSSNNRKNRTQSPEEYSGQADTCAEWNSNLHHQNDDSWSSPNSPQDMCNERRSRFKGRLGENGHSNQSKHQHNFNKKHDQNSSIMTEKKARPQNTGLISSDHKLSNQDVRTSRVQNSGKDHLVNHVKPSPKLHTKVASGSKDQNESAQYDSACSPNTLAKKRQQSSKQVRGDQVKSRPLGKPRHPVDEENILHQEESKSAAFVHVKTKSRESSVHQGHETCSEDNDKLDKRIAHKGRDVHGSSSDSDDEAVGKYHEAMTRLHTSKLGSEKQNYMWETRSKYSPLSAEYDGYSSEVSADEGVRKSKDLAKMSEKGTDEPKAEKKDVEIDTSKSSAEVKNKAINDLAGEKSDVKKKKKASGEGKSAAKVNKSSGRAKDDSAQNKKKKDRKKNKKNTKKTGCCG